MSFYQILHEKTPIKNVDGRFAPADSVVTKNMQDCQKQTEIMSYGHIILIIVVFCKRFSQSNTQTESLASTFTSAALC